MNSKLVIIVILLVIVIATLFNISGVAQEIKYDQLMDYSENQMQVDIIGQNLGTAMESAKQVDKTRDTEGMFIGIIITVQVVALAAFILQNERKISFPTIFIILGVTLLPIQYVYAVGEDNKVEIHHINMYHMEYVEGEKARFNLESELYAKDYTVKE